MSYIYVDVIAYSMFLASFSRMSYIYMYTFSFSLWIPGNQTHDLTIASAIRYYLSYENGNSKASNVFWFTLISLYIIIIIYKELVYWCDILSF